MKSNKEYRFKDNPKEKELHDRFITEYIKCKLSPNAIDYLVFGHKKNIHYPDDFLSDREKRIVISTIQWLGSPVGQGFLSECGFEIKE